ncbi:MAG: FKBP-type peptidyl-prolyl cis-trans isomerase [Chitinophagaceae bacterium]|nr:FKBP-type peptidyl-prolyl cis-trans isomerase [Chitinophagaceae bacterium]
MNTIKNLVLFLFAIAVVTGCNKATYKKTAGGMPYQLYKGKDTQSINPGNFVKVHITQKIQDSVYYTTVGTLPIFLQVNSAPQPYDIAELWTKLKVGDSVIATQMMDTFIKRSPENVSPKFKKGDKIITYIKVIGVYANDSLARVDDQKAKNDWLEKEIKFIEKYLAEKNIVTQKTTSGAFVQLLTPGTGNLIDSGNYVTVNYTGATFAGKKFDSSTDTSFHHVEPYSFVALSGQMIKGFDEALKFMRIGSTAKVYIPSILGYGANPGSPLIKPFDNLIFDLEIVNIQDKEPTKKQMPITPVQ